MRGGDAAGEGPRVAGAKRWRRAMFIARDIANDSQALAGRHVSVRSHSRECRFACRCWPWGHAAPSGVWLVFVVGFYKHGAPNGAKIRGGDAAGEGPRVIGAKRRRRTMFIARDIANDSQATAGRYLSVRSHLRECRFACRCWPWVHAAPTELARFSLLASINMALLTELKPRTLIVLVGPREIPDGSGVVKFWPGAFPRLRRPAHGGRNLK